MPSKNLPILGPRDDKYIDNAVPAPPSGLAASRRQATGHPGRKPPASFRNALVRHLVRTVASSRLRTASLRRIAVSLRRNWAVSASSLSERQQREFELLTHYANSSSRRNP